MYEPMTKEDTYIEGEPYRCGWSNNATPCTETATEKLTLDAWTEAWEIIKQSFPTIHMEEHRCLGDVHAYNVQSLLTVKALFRPE